MLRKGKKIKENYFLLFIFIVKNKNESKHNKISKKFIYSKII